ncbi:unnamed protein product [Diamesa serratosioi]
MMGNFFSYFEPLQDNNRPEFRQTNHNKGVVLSKNPQLILYNNVINKIHNAEILVGRLEQREVAIKRIDKNRPSFVEKESELLGKLDCHPNILRYFFKARDEQFLYIVYENYGPTLERYFKDGFNRQKLPIKKVMEDVSNAINFLNKFRILHLNINPRSVVVVSRSDMFIAKLANFNSAMEFDGRSFMNLKKIPGIEGYQAPEFFLNRANISSDIYSMGCLFFYLLSNGSQITHISSPVHDQRISTRLQIINQNNSSNTLCVCLITEMLKYDEMKRIKIGIILQHPYFFTPQQNLILILDAHKLIESKTELFRKLLYTNMKAVIGKTGCWRDQVDNGVLKLLLGIRKAHLARVGSEFSEDQPKGNIINLIQTIRNSVVHSNSELKDLSKYFGNTTESYLNYWIDKFPNLISHLHITFNDYNDAANNDR